MSNFTLPTFKSNDSQHRALLEALDQSTATQRRNALRQLAMPYLKTHEGDILRAAQASPDTTYAPNHSSLLHLEPTATLPRVRDLLHPKTLLDIILFGSVGVARAVEAMTVPGKAQVSSRSKLGHSFGLHEDIPADYMRNVRDQISRDFGLGTPGSSGASPTKGKAKTPASGGAQPAPNTDPLPFMGNIGITDATSIETYAPWQDSAFREQTAELAKPITRALREIDKEGSVHHDETSDTKHNDRSGPVKVGKFNLTWSGLCALHGTITQCHGRSHQDEGESSSADDDRFIKSLLRDHYGVSPNDWGVVDHMMTHMNKGNISDKAGKIEPGEWQGGELPETAILAYPAAYDLYRRWCVEADQEPIRLVDWYPDGDAILGQGSVGNGQEFTEFAMPDSDKKDLVNVVLQTANMPTLEEIAQTFNEAVNAVATVREEIADKDKELDRLRKAAAQHVGSVGLRERKVEGDGTVPEGQVVMKQAKEVFGLPNDATAFDFEVPTFVWDGQHPDVPEVDESYIFRPELLDTVLRGLLTGRNTWLHGHTGSGKTTLIEQVAARLNYPVRVVNFDSNITRPDLIGKDTIKTNAEGQTFSEWLDGIIPEVMSRPCILVLDELDAIHPDVAFVMQRVLEGNDFTVLEDGGRKVYPDSMFRVFGTGNSKGQGDEYGMYPNVRDLSMAFLNRFAYFKEVPYLEESQRRALIADAAPSLTPGVVDKLAKYVTEHMEAFTSSQVMQPISPRQFRVLAEEVAWNSARMSKQKQAIKAAFDTVILSRCRNEDQAVLRGIADRVL